jgi:hypothetical protein
MGASKGTVRVAGIVEVCVMVAAVFDSKITLRKSEELLFRFWGEDSE